MKNRIVILGGGFGGLGVAMRLARLHVDAEIILIDSQSYHLYTPWLYRIPSDAWHKRSRRMCEFYYRALLQPYRDRVDFRQLHVERINTDTQHIVFENGNTLHYSHLVIALGSRVNFFGMHDVEVEGHTLNTPDSVANMQEVCAKLLHASKEKRKKHIVIAGAGATGVEMCMELGFLRKKHNLQALDITLIDAGSTLLPRFSPFIQRHAMRRVRSLNVRVLHKTIVRGIRGGQVTIQQNGIDSTIHADVLAWAAGVRPNVIVAGLPYAKDDSGRLLVTDFLEVEDAPNVWAVGDSASVWDSHNECVVPPTAWAAVDQSVIVAGAIAARLRGEHPISRYIPPKKYPGVLALGGLYAAGGGYGINVFGIVGWVAKQFIHVRYFTTIMTLRSALRALFTKKHICGTDL